MDIEFDIQEMLLRTANAIFVLDYRSYGHRPVLRYSLKGKFISKHNSLIEASFVSGVDVSSISRICRKKQNPTKFIFEYEKVDFELPNEPLNNLLDFL